MNGQMDKQMNRRDGWMVKWDGTEITKEEMKSRSRKQNSVR